MYSNLGIYTSLCHFNIELLMKSPETMRFEVREPMPLHTVPAPLHNTPKWGGVNLLPPLPPIKPRSFRWEEAWHEVHHLYLYSQAGQLSKYPGDDNLHALSHPE